MAIYMLDTSIASAVIAGRLDVDAQLASLGPQGWCISAVTRAELAFGTARRPEATKLARLVGAFLAAARTEPFDDRAADEFGQVRASLERAGRGIGTADELIAAHALSSGATLVTDNERHFGRIERLRFENWLRSPPDLAGEGRGVQEPPGAWRLPEAAPVSAQLLVDLHTLERAGVSIGQLRSLHHWRDRPAAAARVTFRSLRGYFAKDRPMRGNNARFAARVSRVAAEIHCRDAGTLIAEALSAHPID